MIVVKVMNTPENIPQEIIEKAEAIVFPSVLKAAFVVGRKQSRRGAMVCRSGEHFHGPWGAPTMMALEGGSVGFLPMVVATDLVLIS